MNNRRAIIAAIGALLLIGLTGAATAADQIAFNGPHVLPGRVQAEDYDNGGAGVAYSDTTAGNAGGAGRLNEGVDVETTNGITNIGWIIDGEWTEYTVTVATSGSYTANFRVGSWNTGRKVALTVDGAASCTVNVPNTGSSTAFTTVSAPLSLSAGTHVIRLAFIGSGQNIDWFELIGGAPVTAPIAVITPAPSGQTAYNGPHAIPGRVQAENFDKGGANVAYSDTTAANAGGAGRLTEGVDVETANGITNIGWIIDGEWTEYTVTVATGGSYTANFRVGSWTTGRKVALTVDGAAGCTLNVPNTGSSTAFTTVSAPLSLSAGTHVIRLTYLGSGQNIDFFEILSTTTSPVPTTFPMTAATPWPTTVPTTSPTSVTGTFNPTMSPAQAASTAAAASSAGYAKLASKQAAHKAWAVPSQPGLVSGATNARTAGLKSDGATDNTAALQSILNGLPAGGKLYFPAGTYRLNGPIRITKPVTLVGEAGTIFDCSRATQYVFTINRGGSPISGMTITGLVIEGPGIETNPAMIDAYNLQNFHVSYVKFHNVGYAAIRINTCTDGTVDHCIFDNVFQTGMGYGVCVVERCDRILIRDNFFVTKGRHSVTTGTSQTSLATADYVRQIIFENNYCENTMSFGSAADTHKETIGPFIVRNNVFNNCQHGVRLRGGYAEIYDNVVIGKATTQVGIYVYDQAMVPNSFDTRQNKIERNTILGTLGDGILCANSNDLVRDNILTGSGGVYGLYVDGQYYTPTLLRIERNIVKGYSKPIVLSNAGSNVQQVTNWFI